MKTVEDLKKFYYKELLYDLNTLEKQREKVVRNLLISAGIILGLVVFVLLMFRGAAAGVIMFPLVIGIILWGGIYYLLTRGYVTDFKAIVIEKIVHFIDENLSYAKDGYIHEGNFLLSQIFKRRPDRYRGDDLVSGKVGATRLDFSEIHAEYRTTDSKGRTQWHTLFKGLFAIADFNKNFKGTTVVLPDTAERVFGHVGTLFQSWNVTRGQLIKLEDPEFEKFFVVYGDDQIEARYILSTSLMKRIVDFKKKSKRPLHLSFVGSMLFVAISYRRNLFEPRVFRTLLNIKPIEEYFEDLRLAIGIVEDLNLNTRIWDKQ